MEDLKARRRQAVQARAQAYIPVAATVVVAAVWMGLAINRPSSTFHFAPPIAALLWPVTARIRNGSTTTTTAARVAAGAFAIVLAAALILAGLDALRGPGIGGSALAEAVIGAAAGAAWGGWVLTRERPGFVLSLLGVPDESERAASASDQAAPADTATPSPTGPTTETDPTSTS